MRKIAMLLGICLIGFGFVGCANNEKPTDPVVTPQPEPPTPTKEKIVIVHFKFNSHRLSTADKKLIDAAVAERQANTKMAIVGYTDSQGSKEYNQKLSEKRAAAVSAYLNSLGVANTALGKGEEGLLNKDLTKAEHKANRRAEVSFTVIIK